MKSWCNERMLAALWWDLDRHWEGEENAGLKTQNYSIITFPFSLLFCNQCGVILNHKLHKVTTN